ncbi:MULTISPECIES: hypothetical protein [unclassified Variovorax]|uniref:hypothetical protein n=1 Tax=unclassified Variovorax TaxID=663243 RepID=UPI0032E60C0D
MAEVRVLRLHRIEFRDERGQPCQATLEIRFRCIGVLPPIGKQKPYPPLELTVLHAQDGEAQSVASRCSESSSRTCQAIQRPKAEVIEKIDRYAMRWKIETFYKILKSGSRAEDSRLRTAERLTNLIAIHCLSWALLRSPAGVAPDRGWTRQMTKLPRVAELQVQASILNRFTSLGPRMTVRVTWLHLG